MSMFHKDLYPTIETFKYPKAGEKKTSVSMYTILSESDQRHQFEVR
jgi:dipeptidyl-peptidase-4